MVAGGWCIGPENSSIGNTILDEGSLLVLFVTNWFRDVDTSVERVVLTLREKYLEREIQNVISLNHCACEVRKKHFLTLNLLYAIKKNISQVISPTAMKEYMPITFAM